MDMAIMQPPTTADQQELNRRYSQSHHSHQQGASQVSYPYELNNNVDCFQQHQITPMTPSINDYSIHHQTATESKVESSQVAVNLTGASSIQPSWIKSHSYLDSDNEYASLATAGYDGTQQTQANAYYIQDPNRSFYLNSTTLSAGQLSSSTNDCLGDYQGYQVYNRSSSWLTPNGEDSSAVCNYGYYETQNQQEDTQAYCQQQTNPSHQYPQTETYDAARFSSYTMTSNHENDFTIHHNHHNHVQNQQSSNFDPNRAHYHDRSCLPVQVGGKSLQHQNSWNQSNFEPCGVARKQSSLNDDSHTNQQNTKLPETDQSWPSAEFRHFNGENQSRQRTTKQQTRFKSLSMVKASNSKQSHSGPIHRANQCGVCGRNYARPSTLKTHLRTHTNERPFKCNVCLKTFSQAANLTAHQRVHTGERPFSCPICGRQFSQSSSVITHLRTHSGERPYRCSMCSRTFSDSSTLTKHCRIHSGEKPYQCDYCPLNFSQSGNLSRHLKLHLMGAASSNGGSSASSATSSSQSSTRYNNVYETQITSTKNKSNSPNIGLATSEKLN